MDKSSKERYSQEITEINNIDPYTLKASHHNKENDLLPSLCYPYLFTYNLAYKSLAAYNQFLDGWVQDIMAFKPLAKVLHSQWLAEKVLQPWISRDGIILSAHCSCTVGLGESCTHVAATLFMLEANTRLKESNLRQLVTGCHLTG
ncbi:hypothetical protein BgiMline_021486 [Biomphalaria glabrata]